MLSQLHVRRLLAHCCKALSASGPLHPAPGSTASSLQQQLRAAFVLALRCVALLAPQTLAALNLHPSRTPCWPQLLWR